ncbi:extracellular solute-binding protein [Paenibacillus aceris]|uniref:Aldouronate transport system substrate-binding protein n=1 Tax=Paenibacillus aceris TaxID=869555 RepID=A0ABS4I7I8_9BACL|nr:extracellular solute-binding protein [Paenibacillus aceris]MBP1966650.1 putative aldouronate transport system substrate-binding protein [Paenibacillus aceris]NHW38886.1 extracellular solute-binding protein [Paenibacillus aceris]
MRKTIHKSVHTTLTVAMASCLVLTACSSSSSSGANDSSGSPAASNAATPAQSSKPITLTVELFDRSNTPAGAPPITDNFMTQYIQENFGKPNNITVKFVTVPRSEEVKKLNVLMASNSSPDIVYTYDKPTVQNYAQSGGLADLGPVIDKYGPQLKKVLAPSLPDGMFNGKQYAIPALRVIQSQTTTFIRKDWLDKLNMPAPTTTDQFLQTMRAFKEKDPGNTGGKVIPYSYIDIFHMQPLIQSFWDWSKITPADLYATPNWEQPGNKEGLKFLNQMYNEGLIDKDFALASDFSQAFAQQMVNGLAGAATPNTNEPVYNGYYSNMKKNNPTAELVAIDPFSTKDGKHPKPKYPAYGAYLMVPKSSPNVEAAVKYLNWMSEPKNILALQNGKEGVSYKLDSNGVPINMDTPEAKQILYNYYDYAIILNGKYVSPDEPQKNIEANATDPNFKDFTVKSIQAGSNDAYTLPRVDTPIQAEVKYATILKDKEKEMLTKIVTAKPADFDKVYGDQVKAYMDMGGTAVKEEKKKAYEEFYKNQK